MRFNMLKPIPPPKFQDREQTSVKDLPDEVIETFNELIQKNLEGFVAKVFQKEAEELLKKKGIPVARIYSEKLLDVEYLFRFAGWYVGYYQSQYWEDWFAPYFLFTAPWPEDPPKNSVEVQELGRID